MRKKISVIGTGVQIAHDIARFAEVGEDPRGAHAVVLADGSDLEAIARSAPAAVVVLVGASGDLEERCREVYDTTMFPRARVVGLDDPRRLADVLEAIVFEREGEQDVVALRDGAFRRTRARLGRGGIRELVGR